MEQANGYSEELTATAIYTANEYNKPTVITFIIGEYVITIDTMKPRAANWDYLKNVLHTDFEGETPFI